MYNCPICSSEMGSPPLLLRYPKQICQSCYSKATDKNGDSVAFANVDWSGGLMGLYLKDKSPYNESICFINNIECEAQEAKFGGIVIQVK